MILLDPLQLHNSPDEAVNQWYWCKDCYHARDNMSLNPITKRSV